MSAPLRRLVLSRHVNGSLAKLLDETGRRQMTKLAAAKLGEVFDALPVDRPNDHNICGTPERVARMFVDELVRGRYTAVTPITEFRSSLQESLGLEEPGPGTGRAAMSAAQAGGSTRC